MKKRSLSSSGETIAAKYLENYGYKIISRNYRYQRAETDIIYTEGNVIVFAEVKTRTNKSFGEPEESVNEKKQIQLVKSAEGFLSEHPEYENYEKRIDVITVFKSKGEFKIRHIKNAFNL
ncbi:MAG: YraN family protein [Ignavibacteria bacterium]|nr:YraN family protein [Ignavibacteria bacterium]